MVRWKDQSVADFNDGSRKHSWKRRLVVAVFLILGTALILNSYFYVPPNTNPNGGPGNGWHCAIFCTSSAVMVPKAFNISSTPAYNNSAAPPTMILSRLYTNTSSHILEFRVYPTNASMALIDLQVTDSNTQSSVIVRCDSHCAIPFGGITYFALDLTAFKFNTLDTYDIALDSTLNSVSANQSVYTCNFK